MLLPGNVFYDYEFLDVVAKLVVRFDPLKESLEFLRDLVCGTALHFGELTARRRSI